MLLPLTVSCFSEIQIGFTFLLPADPGSPGKRAVKRVCGVCVCVCLCLCLCLCVSVEEWLTYHFKYIFLVFWGIWWRG